MMSAQEFWMILGLTAIIALLLGAGVGYLLLPKKEQREEPKTKQKVRAKDRDKTKNQIRRMYQLISDLTVTLNYSRVLEKSLDAAFLALRISEVPTDRLISAVLLFAEEEMAVPDLVVAYSRGLPRPDMTQRVPGLKGLLEDVIESGDPHMTEQLSADPELKQFIAFRACTSGYCIPLRAGLDTFGVLLFAHPEKGYFTIDAQEIINTVAHQAQLAMQNAHLFQELTTERDQIIKVQKEAQRRLAAALHDGPTQTVAAIPMQISRARHLLTRGDVDAAGEALYQTEELARRTSQQIRHMLFTLRPLVLDSEGLVAALQSMAKRTRETFGQDVVVETDVKLVEELDMNTQTVIFTIAEEAVNNARKHAKAEHIWVKIKRLQDDLAFLEIEDDGKGFLVEDVMGNYDDRGSLGMLNMRERAELVQGVFHIKSIPGEGTQIQIVLPLTPDAADRLRLI
ncbi:MAG: GAF domain-containing protein [Anaerolineales bacterium]|jgi:signal transduction histidine kinase|nr:GAF domain-containing protein [Anaerolineales bacterium]